MYIYKKNYNTWYFNKSIVYKIKVLFHSFNTADTDLKKMVPVKILDDI
jgi:hypothetical protein